MLRIDCRHGYFVFEETTPGSMGRFMDRFGLDIERSGDHFTFSDLVDAPDYSLPGGTFLGIPTTVVFEGRPWEVMRENGLIYNFNTGLVMPILTVTQRTEIIQGGNFFTAGGMILPGSITDDGSRVTDYSAFFSWERLDFKYGELSRE